MPALYFTQNIASMLQRIQSIWLFLATICFAGELLPQFPLVQTAMSASGLFEDQKLFSAETKYTMAGAIGSAVFVCIAIFLFKNRPNQILLVAFSNLIQLGLVIGFTFYQLYEAKLFNSFTPDVGFMLAMGGLVFSWLASRAIRKDENLVRDMDRLR